MTGDESKQLIDLALSVYREAYSSDSGEEPDEIRFLDFVFIHLSRQNPQEYGRYVEALKRAGVYRLTDLLDQLVKKL
jgi:hypothetical protein